MNTHPMSHQSSQQANRYTLFIDSIHEKLTKSKVQSILERFANIVSIHLPKIKKGKKKVLMGYGTVAVEDHLSFSNLISEEILIKGKRVHIEPFNLETDDLEEKHQQYMNRLVFASNVPKKITASDIKNLFEERFGAIVSCSKSVTATGRIKPFGFIVFQSTESAVLCAQQKVVLGDNFAISVRRFEEDKPSNVKKVQDRKQRVKAKMLQQNNSGFGSNKNDSEPIEIQDDFMGKKIEGTISQDRSGLFASKLDSSLRGLQGTCQEISNPVLTGTTRCTFPSSRVRKVKLVSEYPKYEKTSLSDQFKNFYAEMQKAYDFQRHLCFHPYEKSSPVSDRFPLQGNTFLFKNRVTNNAQKIDHTTDCHLRKRIIKKVEKNHNFRNLRINRAPSDVPHARYGSAPCYF